MTISEVTETPATSSNIITVDAKAFTGLLTDLLLFVSKDGCMPAIAAIQLQQGVVNGSSVLIARATDRYALAESYIPISEGSWPFDTLLLPTAAVKQLITVSKSSALYVQLNKKDSRQLTIDNFSSQATVFGIDAEFPNIKSLWLAESVSPKSVYNFNATALTRPSTVAKRRKESLRIHVDRKNNVLATISDNFRVVIMPERDHSDNDIVYIEPTC